MLTKYDQLRSIASLPWIELDLVFLVYCNRTNFRTRFNFVYFVLLAESTKFSSVRKPYTYTSVSDTTVAVRKFLAYESRQTLEYEFFSRTKISAITVSARCTNRLTNHNYHPLDIIRLIPKTIGNRKEDCAWSCSRWQTQPEKICKSQRTNQCHSLRALYWFVLCNLQISQVVFVTSNNFTHNLLFYFQ